MLHIFTRYTLANEMSAAVLPSWYAQVGDHRPIYSHGQEFKTRHIRREEGASLLEQTSFRNSIQWQLSQYTKLVIYMYVIYCIQLLCIYIYVMWKRGVTLGAHPETGMHIWLVKDMSRPKAILWKTHFICMQIIFYIAVTNCNWLY